MTANRDQQRLDQYFDALSDLNPHAVEPERHAMIALAGALDAGSFDYFGDRTQQLIKAYLASPVKTSQNEILDAYFALLSQAGRQLAPPRPPGRREEALARHAPALGDHWYRALEQAGLEPETQRAVDAARHRNERTPSVVAIALDLLHAIDQDEAFDWEVGYLEATRGDLDMDIIRDVVRAWHQASALPPAALDWLTRLGLDETISREWPWLASLIDRALRRHALRAWRQAREAVHRNLVHLRLIADRDPVPDADLVRWLDAAVTDLGDHIQSFMATAVQVRRVKGEKPLALEGRLVAQLTALGKLFPLLLTSADLLLREPGGAYWFALGLLGISKSSLRRWRESLEQQAARVIYQLFLQDLRNDRSPLGTIRRFCLGDSRLCTALECQLDLLTKQFDSVEQRDIVVEELATIYGSSREEELVSRETTKRYRRLMQMLHEDSLRALVPEGVRRQLMAGDVIPHLTTLAAGARRFLAAWRNAKTSVADTIEAEAVFVRQVRQARVAAIRQLLGNN